ARAALNPPDTAAPGAAPAPAATARGADAAAAVSGVAPVTAPATTASLLGRHEDPRSFLLVVMNDATAPLALRIEAAKALLLAPGTAA
ncbi:MAG: hypothetical protein ACR2JA_04545, partial [Hydrogenophaga sp.]